MDGIQTLLVAVVLVLTTLLVLVGIQVLLILFDLRRGVKKINTILDDSLLGGGLIRTEKLAGILELFKKGKK
jgi:hypothetical protein